MIDGIDCYDIRYYNTNFIHNVLEQERPVAVVMLNSTFITDRSLILSCKKLNIKSIYLAHGALIREEFIDKSIKVFNESFKGTRLQRAIKNLRGTVLNFLVSTARFNKKILLTLHPYSVLLNTLINPGTYLFFPPPSFDLEPDLVLVYGKDDADFYLNRLQIDPCKVMIVGNPELDSFFQNSDVISQDKDI